MWTVSSPKIVDTPLGFFLQPASDSGAQVYGERELHALKMDHSADEGDGEGEEFDINYTCTGTVCELCLLPAGSRNPGFF